MTMSLCALRMRLSAMDYPLGRQFIEEVTTHDALTELVWPTPRLLPPILLLFAASANSGVRAALGFASISFSEEDLLRFAGLFFPPGPDEPHITYDGNLESVIATVIS